MRPKAAEQTGELLHMLQNPAQMSPLQQSLVTYTSRLGSQPLFLLSSRPGSCRDHLHLLSALPRTLLTKEKQSTTRMWTPSSCREGGLLSSCGTPASHCGGFSCCEAQALGCVGFSSCGAWA